MGCVYSTGDLMTERAFHTIADIFPLMDGQPLADLTEDVKTHGLREPIWLYEGQILDGRNRYRACLAAGVEPVFVDYNGDDALGFVVSLNLHRRHLNESQRGMVGANIATLKQGEVGRNHEKSESSMELSEAARLFNVGVETIKRAKQVIKNGVPELQQQVSAGNIKVRPAADISKLPAKEQLAILKKEDPKAVQQAAKEIRAEKETQRREQRMTSLKAMAEPKPELNTEQKYSVIYADPPWQYERPVSDSRKVENQYPVMSLDDIKALPVNTLATDTAILYLWATSPKLEEAMSVMNAWGFSYRSCAVWDKEVIGMGYWFRQQTELLLVGIRGAMPSPEPASRVSSLITSKRGKHSQKLGKRYIPTVLVKALLSSSTQNMARTRKMALTVLLYCLTVASF